MGVAAAALPSESPLRIKVSAECTDENVLLNQTRFMKGITDAA